MSATIERNLIPSRPCCVVTSSLGNWLFVAVIVYFVYVRNLNQVRKPAMPQKTHENPILRRASSLARSLLLRSSNPPPKLNAPSLPRDCSPGKADELGTSQCNSCCLADLGECSKSYASCKRMEAREGGSKPLVSASLWSKPEQESGDETF